MVVVVVNISCVDRLSFWSSHDRVDISWFRSMSMELASPQFHPAQAVSRPTVVRGKHDQADDKQRDTRQERKHESDGTKYQKGPAAGITPQRARWRRAPHLYRFSHCRSFQNNLQGRGCTAAPQVTHSLPVVRRSIYRSCPWSHRPHADKPSQSP
jgi:hypothetical protein